MLHIHFFCVFIQKRVNIIFGVHNKSTKSSEQKKEQERSLMRFFHYAGQACFLLICIVHVIYAIKMNVKANGMAGESEKRHTHKKS